MVDDESELVEDTEATGATAGIDPDDTAAAVPAWNKRGTPERAALQEVCNTANSKYRRRRNLRMATSVRPLSSGYLCSGSTSRHAVLLFSDFCFGHTSQALSGPADTPEALRYIAFMDEVRSRCVCQEHPTRKIVH